jgi:hypothetical protein
LRQFTAEQITAAVDGLLDRCINLTNMEAA